LDENIPSDIESWLFICYNKLKDYVGKGRSDAHFDSGSRIAGGRRSRLGAGKAE